MYDPQSTIAAFKAKNGYESATSGIENKDKIYNSIDDAFKIQNGKERSDAYKNILKQIDDEGIFIPISHGSMTVVAPKDLEKYHSHNHSMNYHSMKCSINKGAFRCSNLS